MQFRQFKDDVGNIDHDYVEYTDDSGEVWIVPNPHRFWDIYQQWISDGNVPLPAN